MDALAIAPMTPDEARFTLRAMRHVAGSDGGLSDEERALLAVASEVLGGGEDEGQDEGQREDKREGEAAAGASPEEAAAIFRSEASRRRFLQMLLVMGMIDNDFCAEELDIVDGYIAALGAHPRSAGPDGIDHMRRVTGGHLLLMRLDVARRVPSQKPIPSDTWVEPGLSSAWDFMRGAARVTEDIAIAWRYKKLGLLPVGTLGREYWAHMTSRRFLFPGERGASLSGTTYHDFIHALCGYDTDAAGEAEVTAFTAGMLKLEDPLALILGSLSMLLLGSKLAPGVPAPALRLDYGRIGRALDRGLRATAELTERWDYWSVVDQPIDALLDRYAIRPG